MVSELIFHPFLALSSIHSLPFASPHLLPLHDRLLPLRLPHCDAADAAYADLINTSIDQRGIDLSDDDLKELNKGGKMWEKGATTSESKMGLLSDLSNVWKALAGGAHIEKNKYGET